MKHIVFDFDGTLVDSMKQWSAKMIHLLETRSISYPENLIKIITPLGDRGTARYFKSTFNLSETEEELIAEMNAYALPEYHYRIPAKDTVPEALQILKDRGYHLSVLTASPHIMLDACLKRINLYDYFDHVWSCDDFYTTKSNVQIYHMVAEQLHTTVSDCIFLDDNINAVTTAKASGMYVIGIYDESSKDDVDRISAVCDAYIYRMEELPKLLEPSADK